MILIPLTGIQLETLCCIIHSIEQWVNVQESIKELNNVDQLELNEMIKEVWEGVYKDIIIQWIILNDKTMRKFNLQTIHEFVESSFDFDICKCFFDMSGKIGITN